MITKTPPLLVQVTSAPELVNTAADLAIIDLSEPSCDDATLSREIGAAVGAGARTVVLCGVTSAADIQHIDVILSVAEAEACVPLQAGIVAIIGDNARGLLAGADFRGCSPRLKALGWNGTRLATDLAARPGSGLPATARHLTRLAAAAAGVFAMDWIDPALEGQALRDAFTAAQHDGFDWVLIENAAQIDVLRGGTFHQSFGRNISKTVEASE